MAESTAERLERERIARVLDTALSLMTFLVDQQQRVQQQPPRLPEPVRMPDNRRHWRRTRRVA